jgi:hypothetical protein
MRSHFKNDKQPYHLKLLQKLYVKHGLKIEGGGMCPEQYYIYTIYNNVEIAYCRLRHGEFTINLFDEQIYYDVTNGDGGFYNDERLPYLIKALHLILEQL